MPVKKMSTQDIIERIKACGREMDEGAKVMAKKYEKLEMIDNSIDVLICDIKDIVGKNGPKTVS
jgi:hypothetical protein